jgi:DNA-binding MarR family transcriptional regulator
MRQPRVDENLRQASSTLIRLSAVVTVECYDLDITPWHYRFLQLAADEPRRASKLAEILGVRRPVVSKVVASLEARGWVTRTTSSDDRRGVEIAATAAGRRILAKAEARITAVMSELLGVELAGAFVDAMRGAQQGMDVMHEQVMASQPGSRFMEKQPIG